MVIVFFCCWFNLAPAQEKDSTGILRIQIDIDEVTLTIDEKNIGSDSYGNRLLKQSSFILSLASGHHNLIFSAENYEPIDTAITIVFNEILALNIKFLVDKSTIKPIVEPVNVNIIAQPDSINILVNNKPDTMTTPVSISLVPGTLSFIAFREGYQSLINNYELNKNKSTTLEFLLKKNRPAKITILDLGLEYKTILVERNVAEAKAIRSKYNNLAEMFVIFPLSQGILAKLILDSNHDSDADVLIISGTILSVGSFLLGKILSKTRKNLVQKYNEQIKVDNQLAIEFNAEIDRTITTQNAENLKQWELENDNKGIIRAINE